MLSGRVLHERQRSAKARAARAQPNRHYNASLLWRGEAVAWARRLELGRYRSSAQIEAALQRVWLGISYRTILPGSASPPNRNTDPISPNNSRRSSNVSVERPRYKAAYEALYRSRPAPTVS
jgi:hypothetical protein